MGNFKPEDHMISMGKNRDNTPRMYLETKWRIVWFREDHPAGAIVTELLQAEPVPLFKATIYNADGGILATGHGSAIDKGNAVWSGRGIEKAETAAIGRALANAGYGTQFTGDDDDSDQPVDSPVERKNGKITPLNGNSNHAEPLPVASGAQWSADEAQAWAADLEKRGVGKLQLFAALGIRERYSEWAGDVASAKARFDAWVKQQ